MVNISSFANSSVELFLRVWVGKDGFSGGAVMSFIWPLSSGLDR